MRVAHASPREPRRGFGIPAPTPLQAVALGVALLFLAGAVGYVVGRGRPPGPESVDVGFLRDMTAHHDQAITMATYGLLGEEQTVRTFAKEVLITQRYEIGLMSAWLGRWGYQSPDEGRLAMGWMGVPTPPEEMPGMASPVQIRALSEAKGRDVDRLFLAMMTEHHRGGVEMATAAAHHAGDRQVRELAEVIARNQRVEVNEFDAARRRLGL